MLSRIGRRSFLGAGAATGLLALRPGIALGRTAHQDNSRNAAARNLIFMVSDGMSTGTLTMADVFARRMHGRTSHWRRMWTLQGMRRALMETSSANAMVTDSAAAGSAWGIGEHIDNSVINITPDGRQPEPIFRTLSRAGKATGLVTTTRLTHATPAAFIANAKSRNDEDLIAAQMIERGIDIMLGGGARHFSDSTLAIDPALHIVRTRDDLAAAPRAARLLGLFTDDHMHYTLDRTPAEPTLAEMTRAALAHLAARPNGFAVQIEGGRIDHAAHNNDACSLIHDQLAFDDAIGVVLDFIADRDDTLLIVTTDHGNANPGFTLGSRACERGLELVANAKHSLDWVFDQVKAGPQDQQGMVRTITEALHAATGATISGDEQQWLARTIVEKARVDGFNAANGTVGSVGAVLANHLAIAFASPNHTSDLCEVTAIGPGSELITPYVDNIDLYRVALQSLAVDKPA